MKLLSKLYTAAEVAEALGTSQETLAQWRYRGQAPQHIRVNGSIRYTATAVMDWIREQNPEVDMSIIFPAPAEQPTAPEKEQVA